MIVEVLKLFAEKGPLLCTEYTRFTKKENVKQSKLNIVYMTDEEVIKYLIEISNGEEKENPLA